MLSDTAIAKKRQFAQERAARLLDPRVRVMGIDKTALDEQLREKAAIQKLEREREEFFDTQAMLMDKHAQVLQREVDEVRRQREREVKEFRETFQRRELSREWDLNDPRRITSALPARVCDDDLRCGAASLQRFEGEDLDSRNRRMAQANQIRSWAQRQTDEKTVKKWMDSEDQRKFEDRAEETAYRTWQIEQEIAQQRKQAAMTTAEFNKAMAEQKRREQHMHKHRTTQKNLEEIDNLLNSDLLNERRGDLPTGAPMSKHDRFKGLSDEQILEIRRVQDKQREELQQKRLQEAEDERQWAQQEALENRMGTALDRQRARERREASVQLGRDRQQQATQATDRRKQLDQTYRNEIGEDYFVWGKCL